MQVRKVWIGVLFFVLATMSSAPAVGPLKHRADLNVREVVSLEKKGILYRVVMGYDEIYPFLVIEKIQFPLVEGAPAKLSRSWRLNDLPGARSLFPAMEGDEIKELRWNGKIVEFTYSRIRQKKKCIVSKIVDDAPVVSCSTHK